MPEVAVPVAELAVAGLRVAHLPVAHLPVAHLPVAELPVADVQKGVVTTWEAVRREPGRGGRPGTCRMAPEVGTRTIQRGPRRTFAALRGPSPMGGGDQDVGGACRASPVAPAPQCGGQPRQNAPLSMRNRPFSPPVWLHDSCM
ncbi:MAG: hypothetical protein AMXMBFR55_20600 [Gemmatimonadota bacterium]